MKDQLGEKLRKNYQDLERKVLDQKDQKAIVIKKAKGRKRCTTEWIPKFIQYKNWQLNNETILTS